jgi:hypothetical protein
MTTVLFLFTYWLVEELYVTSYNAQGCTKIKPVDVTDIKNILL